MGIEPKKRRSSYVSNPSVAKGHVVKGGRFARVRVDGEGRMTIVLGGTLTLRLVCGRRGDLEKVESRIALRRALGVLATFLAVPVVESIEEKWFAALPEGGEQNGGVES